MSEPPAWTQAFIGIPFKDLGRDLSGCDCYGLNRLVMLSLGVELPLHNEGYEAADDHGVTGRLIEQGIREQDCWRPVPWSARRPFDWVVYCKGELPVHLALVADPDWIFHTRRGAVSGSERVASVPLRHHHAMIGMYRHSALEGL